MVLLYFILLLVAVLCFIVGTKQSHLAKFNLVSLGLALAFAVPLIQTAHKL